jgi:hypothetical protein
MSRWNRPIVGLALVLAGVSQIGCSAKVNNVEPPKEWFNIIYVGTAFSEAETKLGHAPKNVDELKPYLKKFGDPDQLLISPNDGLPFVVRYGLVNKGTGYPIIAYEQKGKDGKHQIIDTQLLPRKITDEQLAANKSLSTPAEANKSDNKDNKADTGGK